MIAALPLADSGFATKTTKNPLSPRVRFSAQYIINASNLTDFCFVFL